MKEKSVIKVNNLIKKFPIGGDFSESSIGHGTGNRRYFRGALDDVRIYNRALSAEEVKALYDLEKPKAK